MSDMTEYELHTQGACHCLTPDYDGRDPMRNRPHSNGTDTTMTIQRYGLGREYAGNTGSPAITEQADGAYVRYEDHQRLQAACEAHNEMLLGRLKLAEGAQQAVKLKEPSDEKIRALFDSTALIKGNYLVFARELLARYGSKS